jgi:NAD+ kinase
MKIAFLASARPAAQRALKELTGRYGQIELSNADYVVAIGGDGTTLKALQATMAIPPKPVFAMRTQGSIGFLGNALRTDNLVERLASGRMITLHPLRAEIEQTDGGHRTLFGINEIVLIRQKLQAVKLRVTIEGRPDAIAVFGDGLLLATPLGSTAYNRAVGGPRLPVGSGLLALTGIAIRQPADWSPMVLDDGGVIDLEVLESVHHPVRAETSIDTVPDVHCARLSCDRDVSLLLVFDRDNPSCLPSSPVSRE